ncbi:MAG: serine protein kinase PrkA [Deltaproteobacteria bacterium]|nr:serine protein kinase PrkA [Deltaproteobacteria bacterium]
MSNEERSNIARKRLEGIAGSFEDQFSKGQLLLSFGEYLDLFATQPARYGRDAATYVRDIFDHFGTEMIDKPWGKVRRWKLFDLPWEAQQDARRDALVGQEEVQAEIYRVLCNFVREGRPNRVILTHGPNGSAKSTLAACIMRALEHYSSLEEGALYRFHWVFPNTKTIKGSIGFSDSRDRASSLSSGASYAHLSDSEIDSRLVIEVRDHPLFLIPVEQRRSLIDELWTRAGFDQAPSQWLLRGQLAYKNQQVFEALLSKYKGSLSEVLRHVQVERYFVSRRYRVGAVTLGPQMSVDAGERQVTADQSLGSLPTVLQATPLFEAFGELVDAHGGVLEFSDLLKRPLDAYKYLQLSVETGEVALSRQNLQLNCVMIGSANEIHLAAFREHPEFPSFRGRLELIRTPYLLSYLDEQKIYDVQIASQVGRHVAPHATQIAAMFAVLTRLMPPEAEHFTGDLAKIAPSLTAIEKADLFGTGAMPPRLSLDETNVLHAGMLEVYEEGRSRPIYEGILGASPREMRGVMLDASQSSSYKCLSPLAVIEELDELCTRSSQFAWLREERRSGGYHDHAAFREILRDRLLDRWEEEMRNASGLVDDAQYGGLFELYIEHVTAWTRGERIRNRATGAYEEANERMMLEVEGLLGWKGEAAEFRKSLLSTIAAWAIDHPGERARNEVVFGDHIKKLREAVFEKLRKPIAELCRDIVSFVRDGDQTFQEPRRSELRKVLDSLASMYGYCDQCARDAAAMLVRKRFRDIIV